MAAATRNCTSGPTVSIGSATGGPRPAPCPLPPPERRHRRNCIIPTTTTIPHIARFTGRPPLVHHSTGSSIRCTTRCLTCTVPVPEEDRETTKCGSNRFRCLPAAKERALRRCPLPPMLTRTTWKLTRYPQMCTTPR